ncbi:mak16 protein [Cystoisospora suis]|uniref:Mak16 protein n=1 Tax=Cystoisospora suis TaxID=483139 RepID=A0A2C6K395_9APIC|nr:mak16 protein [Cystoisospora suis]
MQNDEVIWNVINKNFCAFKVTTLREDMCRNEYNVTGKCNRVSCPLANSNYGTVIEHQGKLYLCLKTVERAHLPKKMWEKIRLPANIKEAKEVIEREMKNVYRKHQIERCKRRTIKLKQMLDRMRRLELKPKEKLVPVKKKTERREAAREKKAEIAAHLEDVIESELLKRLQQGVYGNLYNFESTKSNAEEQVTEDPEARQQKAEQRGAVSFEEDAEDITSGSEEESEEDSEDEEEDDFEWNEDDDEDIEDFELEEEDSSQPPAKSARRSSARVSVHGQTTDDASSQERTPIAPDTQRGRLLPVAGLKRQLAKRGRPRAAIAFEEEPDSVSLQTQHV